MRNEIEYSLHHNLHLSTLIHSTVGSGSLQLKESDEDYENESESETVSGSPTSQNEIIIEIEPIKIENIQAEDKLIEYTQNHFIHRVNDDLRKIREYEHIDNIGNLQNHDQDDINNFHEKYIRGNSPVSNGSFYGSANGSANGSEYNSGDDDYDDEIMIQHMPTIDVSFTTMFVGQKIKKYKKFGYIDIEKIIDKYYDDDIETKYSSDVDILTTYMKGQKNLYIQSKHLTQRKLNCLMFPSLFFTAFITILAPFIECKSWSGIFISACNALITLFISIINYLKLESSSEIYMQIANQYDKMESSLEMANNKLVVLEKEEDKKMLVLRKIKEVEQKMLEIKDANTILIPEEIKALFPIICHINIFSFINKIETHKKKLILKFKDVKNEIRFILYKWEKHVSNERSIEFFANATISGSATSHTAPLHPLERLKEKNRLLFLYDVKDKLKAEIIDCRGAYRSIDEIFTREIKRAESTKMGWVHCILCIFCKPAVRTDFAGLNPVVDKYFNFMFVDE